MDLSPKRNNTQKANTTKSWVFLWNLKMINLKNQGSK